MSNSELLQQQLLENEDPHVLGQLLLKYQDRLERIVDFRMDRRLKSRIDASDVLQDAFIEATLRINDYRNSSDDVPFFLWLRFITLQKLTQLHRHHLGVQARDASREIPLSIRTSPQATSIVLAAQLLGKMTSPSNAAMRAETKLKLEEALAGMEYIDREVLALRHYEHLSNGETAKLLGLSDAAASNRYFRAVRRLKAVMDKLQRESEVYFD